MRALHIFPTFGSEPTDGSDYYQRMLTRALAASGVDVSVLAACSRSVSPHGAFGLGWRSDYRAGAAVVDGIQVRRFPVTFSPGRVLGNLLSRAILARWHRERGSDDPESFHARALARPAIYDYLALAARGPHSAGLVRAALAAARRADVILAGFTPFATLWYAAWVAERSKVPLVLLPLFHPEDPHHHFRGLYRCFARADALLAQTAYSADLFARLIPGSNPVEIGAGVDPGEFADDRVDAARFRQRYGLGDAKIVLFVGRKERHKRYDLAVEAVERIADQGVRLVMIGSDVDHRPLASARVSYLGALPRADLLDAYDACDVFVLPSERESLGIVFLEAWMRRKPVIGNAGCRPVASLIDHGRDGLLARDAAEMAEQITALLTDPERARRMGEAGRAKVLGRYTWERVGAAVRSLYEQLTRRNLTTPGGRAR